MVYTSREKLTVFELQDDTDRVGFDGLAKLLTERPSNMIYCEKKQAGGETILHGIISCGDIHRAVNAGQNDVAVNTNFTGLNGSQYLRAKKIFRDNEKINALPIVDADGKLTGDYTRWADRFQIKEFDDLRYTYQKYADKIREKIKKAVIVKPAEVFPKKLELENEWKELFEEAGVETEVISWQDVESIDKDNDIFFVDEDELRGSIALYKMIYGKDFEGCKVHTFKWIDSEINDEMNVEIDKEIDEKEGADVAGSILKEIAGRGIFVRTIQITDNGSAYWKNLIAGIEKKYADLGKEQKTAPYEEFWEEFFDDIYNYEYADRICNRDFWGTKCDGVVKLNDAETSEYHVHNGERLTIGQPEEYRKCIYFFGACLVVGPYTEDAHTIESYLQKLINDNGYKIKVVNYGSWSDELSLLRRICQTNFKRGDIAVVFDKDRSFAGIPSLNLADCLERENISYKWMSDKPEHCNYKVNRLYAQEIYRFIEDAMKEDTTEEEPQDAEPQDAEPQDAEPLTDILINTYADAYIEKYFSGFKAEGTVGTILMNCNPFTWGHRYLVEQALKTVDHLIVFVVEEDTSIFTFNERYAMVREGTQDLKNVTVVPSGKFWANRTTFPEYFMRVDDKDIGGDGEKDVIAFARYIAPKLNITYRFVGEENTDKMTARYNLAMKRILPGYGVQVVEIPRATIAGESISAKTVRKRLEVSVDDDLDDMIPRSTRELLVQSWE
jgi:cytidyltransferase-like protein